MRWPILLVMLGCGHASSTPTAVKPAEEGQAWLREAREIARLSPASTSPEHARCAALYKRACEASVWEACADHGGLLLEGTPTMPRDAAAGEAILRQACAHGSGRSCGGLGWWLHQRDPSSAEAAELRVRAHSLIEQACRSGDGWSCHSFGLAHAYGAFPFDGKPDPAEAERYFGLACAAGVTDGCVYAAELQINRASTRGEVDAARKSLRDSCDAGHSRACDDLRATE